MKNIFITGAAALLALVGCTTQSGKDALVVYYSQTGNTEIVAQCFQAALDADIIKLECEVPYPDDYNATIEESRPEIFEKTGRALKQDKIDLSSYETIYVGYPVWYGTIPPPVLTFLKANDFKGKVIVPFCTFGSGGLKSSSNDIAALCPDAEMKPGFGIAGRRAAEAAEAEIAEFLAGGTGDAPAYSEPAELSEDDMAVYEKATEPYAYLNLNVKQVAKQGANYIFYCDSAMGGGEAASCEVYVFDPAEGDPYVKYVER